MYRGFTFGLMAGFLIGAVFCGLLGFAYVWLTGLI
jgi:hypothetical protein